MVAIVGKYVYEKNEGFEEFMKKVAGTAGADLAKHVVQSKPTFEVTFADNKYTITVVNGEKSTVNTFELEKEFDEIMPHGATSKTIVTKNGDKFTFVSSFLEENTLTRVYEFTTEGVTVHLSEKKFGGKAIRYYKRV